MPELIPFRVAPKAFHELVIMPQFGDFLEGDALVPSPEEGDWQIMDDVVYQRPIIDLFGNQNILKRRDATCKLIYSAVGRLGARYIRTEKLYAATEDCVEEFYQGCFEDYEQQNFDLFFEQVMPILYKGIAADMYSNKYFGDISRPSDVNGTWSWNKFDGIFTQLAKYVASGVIPADQTFAIPSGQLTPQQAHDAIKAAYDAQDFILAGYDDDMKAIYVNKKLASAYHDWLVLSGQTTITDLMSGQPKLFYKGIEVKVKKWDGVLAALNGGVQAHAILLTLRGNWLYGADSKYGGGPRRNEAVRIWWSDDDNVWKRQVHVKAGTEIAAPQYTVIGLTEM